MLDKLEHIIPFMALATKRPPEVNNRPLLTRLSEQALVGIIAAAVGVYVNDIRQTEQINNMNARMERNIAAQKDAITEIKSMVAAMQHDLYIPAAKAGK
jgi:ATP-dependent Clp protease ATP-binding subunit ClpA